MTVVAIYRGTKNSQNAMIVDSICTSTDVPEKWTDKLSVIFGNTYVTAVGDPDIIEALRHIVDFVEPKRPNLRSPEVVASLLDLVERIWLLRERSGEPSQGSNGSVLFVCTRNDVFFWILEYDNDARRFVRPAAPTQVGEGDCVVYWGSNRFDIGASQLVAASLDKRLQEKPHEGLIDIIRYVDKIAREQGKKGLRYQLSPPFSSVVVPHKSSLLPRRIRPFSLPELIVRQVCPEQLAILQEDYYPDYCLPPAT